MLNEKLKSYHIILASGSPRRQQFFKDLGLDFEIRLKPVKEEYPSRLRHFEISDYLAQLKALPFKDELKNNDILITSDTIVWHNNQALGKPKNEKTVNAITKVTFKDLSKEEIEYYIKTCKPFDKAGAYGIQEWIGQIGITSIEGSYFNVVGLPTHLVYKTLNNLVK